MSKISELRFSTSTSASTRESSPRGKNPPRLTPKDWRVSDPVTRLICASAASGASAIHAATVARNAFRYVVMMSLRPLAEQEECQRFNSKLQTPNSKGTTVTALEYEVWNLELSQAA